jgi:ParB family transcriptional regulator, chromosome partitioning protein
MKTSTVNNALKAEVNKSNYVMVAPSEIIADEKQNPRYDYGDIEELMLSIVENGIRNPLKGYQKDGKIILKDGHRRMRAVKMALEKGKKIERVPVILESGKLNEEERTLEYIIYNDGKALSMLEQSEVIRRLLNFGWKVTDVVKRTGKARGYIENLILLTQAPVKVQHYVKETRISAHAVIQIMQAVKGNSQEAIKQVEQAIETAKASGKEKATPKHVGAKEVREQSYGKFYKWAQEVCEIVSGEENQLKERVDFLDKLMTCFENGQPARDVAQQYFMSKPNTSSAMLKEPVKAKVHVAEKKSPASTKKAGKTAKNKSTAKKKK